MADKTTETTITFKNPFKLSSLDESQPAGAYLLVTEEDQILGISFTAFIRTATMLHIPAISTVDQLRRVIMVNFEELAEALDADGRI